MPAQTTPGLAATAEPPPLYRVDDLEAEARLRLDPVHRDFFAGGAGDERTLRANETAFDGYRILPRVLRGGGERDLRIELFGETLPMPVLVSPTAFHRLAHPQGEVATARAVGAAGTVLVVSMAATTPIEAVAGAAGRPARLWFQLYPQPDLGFTASVIRRAEAAGCRALVVTVDSPVFGRRDRDLRNGFLDLPPGCRCENMRDPASGRVRDIVMDATLDWARIEWLRATTRLPIVLKGILHPADARLAVAHGVDAVLVSNHGGRQLDGAPASIDALPAVVAAVEGRIPVLLDGGIRRGTDILTALALGAVAVGIGRPVVWALAARGEPGVRQLLDLLRAELARAMTLAGAVRPADLTREMILDRMPV
ncbi:MULTISPECIES: alpha-hydroxy acid oxidase [unclassified Micromonospora]|uniref:alpha-hydroxy acid oxidase n=1 Tax=unclassified Micromonospora TaxID=2617518 RepID=UPI0022B5EA26|nr:MULTISPECIES: alpha-hydroxy acid oxidase [unclassified Micromonospora]MCZ7423491.1 alpha-hydroxy acid oxidase [Verrucosispora sp. WMMA2121]WBB91184.1 alpha-hydroxy acid oxidase [Verrucosispora sp. WMMC514]